VRQLFTPGRSRVRRNMANRDIVAIGTSAGGFNALRFLASEFPPDLPATVLVVIHLPVGIESHLDALLTKIGPLTACFARGRETMERGRIYIAPPACHLLVDGDRLALGGGPRENHVRPAIDPLFRSAAVCCGHRTIGVVLTGTMGDGASGLQSLKECGGLTVVQDPSDAAFAEMPATALRLAKPDHVADLRAMPELLAQLVNRPAGPVVEAPERLRYEVDIARNGHSSMSTMDRIGRRSVMSCPDCNGVLWEIDEDDVVRYRCHVGHAYTAELLSLALDDNLRRALASALRALDERIALARKLRQQASDSGHRLLAESWARKLRETEEEAKILRDSTGRAEEIARRYAQSTPPDEVSAERRKRAR
jgi:two-component system, chemotaxis family, protein-glutamate methylesterase/glutaminase